jgi:hypothetical protein
MGKRSLGYGTWIGVGSGAGLAIGVAVGRPWTGLAAGIVLGIAIVWIARRGRVR